MTRRSTAATAVQGAGATACLGGDLPARGAGWVEYDPTNGLIAGENLHPCRGDAGSDAGGADRRQLCGRGRATLGMEVEVTVRPKFWSEGS